MQCSMLIGTLPVFFIVAPCTVAGALLLKEGDVWESASTTALAVSAAIQVRSSMCV
jgi:hypothetical protein